MMRLKVVGKSRKRKMARLFCRSFLSRISFSGIHGHTSRSIYRQYSDEVRHRINIGTIGHIDHGKTTLTAAITRVLQEQGRARFLKYDDIDRAPEEKARGITINACHVGYSTETRDYAHTDCPGHVDYIKNMIVGASQMDGAILVIAATDGTMPQTHEHLMLAKQLGLKHIVVYINKVDVVDQDTVELVQLETMDLLEEIGYNSSAVPFVSGSALCALEDTNHEIGRDSILQLLKLMDDTIEPPQRKSSGPFVMPIEKVLTIPGRGTVLVGTIAEGEVNKGDSAIVQGYGRELRTTVTGIGMFENTLDTAQAGDNVGLLVRGLRKEASSRGMCISHQDAGVSQHEYFRAQVYIRRKAEGGRIKPIVRRYINSMYLDTWDIAACMMIPDGVNLLMPGDALETNILLRLPMPMRKGQKFFIRDGLQTTVNGVVLDLLPPSGIEIVRFNKRPEDDSVVIESNAQVVRKKKFEAMARAQKKITRTK